MKIYLAGKIAWNDYRHGLIPCLRDVDGDNYLSTDSEWPILERVIFGRHDYVGPYAIGCDHGCYHGPNTHGYGIGCGGKPTQIVSTLCKKAIDISDIVFAWIDAPDAYGTIFEIGYAIAKGKNVFLAIKKDLKCRRDMWFIKESLQRETRFLCEVVYAETAIEALELMKSDWHLAEENA